MPRSAILAAAAALVLAGGSGFLVSTALSQAGEPTRTVTIDVGTGARGATGPAGPAGERGPAGPRGPAGSTGPAGTFECGVGFELGLVVINHAGGHTTIKTCLED
jgi:hypothetical protein